MNEDFATLAALFMGGAITYAVLWFETVWRK
jgi:hypothetical protein